MNRYYVYEWYNIDNGEIFYVGKGTKNRYKEIGGRSKKFKEYYNCNNCSSRIIKDNLLEEEAYRLENKTILKYRNIYKDLCNIDDGGVGLPILKGEKNAMWKVSPKDRMSPEVYTIWKRKQQENKIGERNPNYNKHTLKGKYQMDKEEALRRQSRPGTQNGRATPIKVFDKNNNFLFEFEYIGACVLYLIENNYSTSKPQGIYSCIWKANKNNSLYLGMYFKY